MGAALISILVSTAVAVAASTSAKTPIRFKDETAARGVTDLAVNATGPTFGDYDGDGDIDVFVPVEDLAPGLADRLFENDGRGSFKDVASANGVQNSGSFSRGAVFCDLDNDGDLDLLSAGKLLVNGGTGRHWLKVRLVGTGSVNRSAIGVPVRVRRGDRVWARQVEAGTGEGNQNDLTLHFGLGEGVEPVTLEIAWPGGAPQQLGPVAVDSLQVVERPKLGGQ